MRMKDQPEASATPAVFWLNNGTGTGRMPVRCGWWISTGDGRRRWRPWRPRGLRA